MGADLYRSDRNVEPYPDYSTWTREQIDQYYEEVYEPETQHPKYFRDSYNSSNLLHKMDMGYWCSHGGPECLSSYVGPNGDGIMDIFKEVYNGEETNYEDFRLHPVGMERLEKELVRRAELLFFSVKDEDDETKKYFIEKFERLLDFLRLARESGLTIECSV